MLRGHANTNFQIWMMHECVYDRGHLDGFGSGSKYGKYFHETISI